MSQQYRARKEMTSDVQDPLPGGRDLEHPSSLCAGAEIALGMQHDCAFSFLPVATSAPGQTPRRKVSKESFSKATR